MTRRSFLMILIVAFVGSVFVLVISPIRFLKFLKRVVANYGRPNLDKDYPTGVLSEKEMKTTLALSEVLMPREEKLKPSDEFFRSHVNRKTSAARGYLKEYKEGVRLLEETTGEVIESDKSFSELSMSEREKVLESILWRYRSEDAIMPFLERVFVSKRRLAFREFVVRDILEAFYESPAGWAVVEYSHYPGVPAAGPGEYTGSIKTSIP